MLKVRKRQLLILIVSLILGAVAACADREALEPTPEASKKFLKLRGYEFDVPSFFRAAAAGDTIAVNGFIAAGINANARDDNGDTALTAAAARGDLQMVNVLLKAGADVNAKGRNGWDSLLLALSGDRNEVADRLLSEPNVDLKAENPEGMTALMLAVWHQRPETVRALIKRGSDLNH
jgi:ankyrin repeat protein